MVMKSQIRTEDDAIRFMKTVKFALRYNSTPGLPLTSMYAAAGDQRRAIELTNMLLSRDEVVETNVVADRLVLVHHSLVPALYALRVRFRASRLSDHAWQALKLIHDDGAASAGDVRRYLGVDGMKRPDVADLAVAELQRDLLVDRGPASVPQNGIPYLSREGYPYRIFEKADPDLVKAASKLKPFDALESIAATLSSVPGKKLVSMFKLCLSAEERKACVET